jgi:DNA sulfur modification protein DndC
MSQLGLFTPPAIETIAPNSNPTEIIELLTKHLENDFLVATWSGGKDSTATLILLLCAALRLKEQNKHHFPIVVLHGDTEVESPPVRNLANRMLTRLEDWASSAGIPLHTHVYRPRLADSFVVNILSGATLPTWPDHRNRQCTSKYKIEPAGKALKQIIPNLRAKLSPSDATRLDAIEHPLILVGTRYGESQRRDQAMKKRSEGLEIQTQLDPASGKPIRRTLAPIAYFEETDVWEVLGLAGLSRTDYPVWQSNFEEIVDLYRDAGGGECPVIATTAKQRTGCGARFGCHMCQAVGDNKSLGTMAADPRYFHLKPLLDIRDYISNIEFDFTKRSWLTRVTEVRDGQLHLMIKPDTLAPHALWEITAAYLTAQRDEFLRAAAFDAAINEGRLPNDPYISILQAERKPVPPRYLEEMRIPQFLMFSPEKLIALDFYTAVYHRYDRPFEILDLYHRIFSNGESFKIPPTFKSPRQQFPEPRWVPIKEHNSWGLIDPLALSVGYETCYQPEELRAIEGEIAVVGPEDSFTVDPDAAAFILHHMYPVDLKNDHDNQNKKASDAVRTYLTLGSIRLSNQGMRNIHKIVKHRDTLEQNGYLMRDRNAHFNTHGPADLLSGLAA